MLTGEELCTSGDASIGGFDIKTQQNQEPCHGLQWSPESWNIDLGWFVLGFPILYFKGRRLMMFQLSGFYCSVKGSPKLKDLNPQPKKNTKTHQKPLNP